MKGRSTPAGRVVLIDTDEHREERTRCHQLAAGEDLQRLSRTELFRGSASTS